MTDQLINQYAEFESKLNQSLDDMAFIIQINMSDSEDLLNILKEVEHGR